MSSILKSASVRLSALLLSALFFGLTPTLPAWAGTGYQQTVVAQDVVVKYIHGEVRFCPKAQLSGMLCRTRDGRLQDWFNPQTYVQAVTGFSPQEIVSVDLDPDVGVIIRFR